MRPILACMLLIYSNMIFAEVNFNMIFKTKKPIMAAIMLEGEYSSHAGKMQALSKAMQQLKIVKEEGVDSILYEFRGGDIMTPPISESNFSGMVEIMKTVIAAAEGITVGVEILWHFPHETLRLAQMSGAKFVRLDFFSDEMIADGIQVPIAPRELMAYKKSIGAEDVLLLTDIQVKYADMIDPSITMTSSATRAESLGSHAVVVSGKASGSSPGQERVHQARNGVDQAKVVIGSGMDYRNAPALLEYADGAIVGTSISTETGGVLVPYKVRRLMKVINKIRNNPYLN